MTMWAVFLASVAGSLHCGAMCGGFAAAVCSGHRGPIVNLGLFHASRGLAYASLGALAGALGQLGAMANIIAGRVQAWIGGAVIVAIALTGVAGYLRTRAPEKVERLIRIGGSRPSLNAATWLQRLRARGAATLRSGGPIGIVTAGAMTALLPCGWLWSYLLLAAAEPDAPSGLALMVAFWLGTLPILVVVGVSSRRLIGRWGRHAPLASAIILITLGLVTIASKLGVLHTGPDAPRTGMPACHHAGDSNMSRHDE